MPAMTIRTFTVAIVDNDLRLLESLGDLLESAGHSARLFQSAEALLEDRVVVSELDCLITDIGMPVIDGPELQKLLNQAAQLQDQIDDKARAINQARIDAGESRAGFRQEPTAFRKAEIDQDLKNAAHFSSQLLAELNPILARIEVLRADECRLWDEMLTP